MSVQVEAPALVRVGTKKTGFLNLETVAEALGYTPNHFAEFTSNYLETTYTVTRGRYTFAGRLKTDQMKAAVTEAYDATQEAGA